MFDKTKVFECPHCRKPLSIHVQTEIMGVDIPEEGNIDWRAGLSDNEKQAVEAAREAGVLDAFKRAVEYGENRPKCIERFFLSFLRSARPRIIPGFAMNALIAEFSQKRVSLLQAQGILAVIVEGSIRKFIPLELAAGKSLNGSKGTKSLRTSADKVEYHNWMKSERPFPVDKAFNINKL